MKNRYQAAVDRVTQVNGVRGALVVTNDDGLIVADSLVEGVRGTALAALATSLTNRMAQATRVCSGGTQLFLHLQAADGSIFVMPASDDVMIVAVADEDANVGLVRLEMTNAVESVA